MKLFFIGLLLGLLAGAPGAYAIGVALEDITVRDFYAASAMNALINNGSVFGKTLYTASFQHADWMMQERKK